jgi:hypothetical protein
MKTKATVQVDVEALARALVPLLVPPLVAALAASNANPTKERRMPPPPPPPPRRLWTEKEAGEWGAAAPHHRIVWDEQGTVLSMDNLRDRLSRGQRVWHVVGWNEDRTRAWLQLDEFDWQPEHALFWLLESEGKQPDPNADLERFKRWQAWRTLNPASEHGPIYPWRKRRRRRQRQ